ncbi:MAG: FtsX-like permease family protein, partial [Candidatus Acidiferrales bacterium]
PRYFETLSIPLLRGRTFTERDVAGAPQVAIVDEAFVRRHFPNEDPLGRGIDIGNGTDGFYEIVGVVGDVHHSGLDATADPTMYVPYAQDNFSSMWMLARTSGAPAQLAGAARSAVHELDRSLPAFAIQPLADVVDDSVAQRRFSMLLLALFAGIALFLAAVGLYGVLSYTVSQRTQEIGLRVALGAQRGDLMRMVVGHGLRLTLIGVLVGMGGALALARYVATQLFDVTPFDPVSYASTALVLLAIASLACYIPARRALRVDPIIALRHE